MANVIFFLHGVGEHADGWETGVVKQFSDFCDGYSRVSKKGDFVTRFKPIGINYSALFKDILVEWAKRKEGIEKLEMARPKLVEKLLGWIAGSDDIEKDFFWTHTFDVLTYYLLPTVRDAVKVRVALQLYEGIKNLGENYHWSIVAHSLGTAVAHDTLHTWYSQPLAGGGILGHSRAPRLLQMVANCSRVLQTDPDAYKSDVRPGKVCRYYFTVQHPLDPVTIIRPFLPANWPGGDEDVQKSYHQVSLEHDYIQQKDIHDLAHYLRHPDVVIPLFRCLAYETYMGKDNEKKYRDSFKLHGDLTDADLIALRKALELLGINLPDKWLGFLTAWQRIRELLDSGGATGGDDGDGDQGADHE
jgi:hypothetical protein